MKRQMWLVLGGVVVVIAIVVLWLMRGGGGGGLHDKLAGSGSASATTVAMTDPGSNVPAPPKPDIAGVMNAPDGSDVTVLPDGTREYRKGNMIVRDHRKGGSGSDKPFEFGSAAHPNALPEQRHKMDPAVLNSMRGQLNDAVTTCGRDVPADMRGPKPYMNAGLTLAVAGGKVTVTGTRIDVKDVVGGATEPTKTCLDTKLRTITTTAPNEPDLTDYSVQIGLPIP